jgi:hypothetical protein
MKREPVMQKKKITPMSRGKGKEKEMGKTKRKSTMKERQTGGRAKGEQEEKRAKKGKDGCDWAS